MPIEMRDILKPKNNNTFALIEACDVLVSTDENGNEKRLDEALEEAKVPETIEASTVKFNNGDTLPEAMSKLTLGGVQVDNDSIVMDENGVLHASKYALATTESDGLMSAKDKKLIEPFCDPDKVETGEAKFDGQEGYVFLKCKNFEEGDILKEFIIEYAPFEYSSTLSTTGTLKVTIPYEANGTYKFRFRYGKGEGVKKSIEEQLLELESKFHLHTIRIISDTGANGRKAHLTFSFISSRNTPYTFSEFKALTGYPKGIYLNAQGKVLISTDSSVYDILYVKFNTKGDGIEISYLNDWMFNPETAVVTHSSFVAAYCEKII